MTSLWSLCLCYGGLFGMGVGLSYTPPLVCGYKHFPQHKGLVSGFVVSGFGAGAFVFNQVGGGALAGLKSWTHGDLAGS